MGPVGAPKGGDRVGGSDSSDESIVDMYVLGLGILTAEIHSVMIPAVMILDLKGLHVMAMLPI